MRNLTGPTIPVSLPQTMILHTVLRNMLGDRWDVSLIGGNLILMGCHCVTIGLHCINTALLVQQILVKKIMTKLQRGLNA